MAEPVENEGAPRTAAGGGGNAFTRKLGPAPVWVWMLAGLGTALAISAFRSGKAKKTTAETPAPGTPTASQTPPFIIQNYPGIGVPGPQGPAGPTGATGPTGPTAPPATPPATPFPPMQGGHPPVAPGGGNAPKPVHAPGQMLQPLEYRVKPGDTLTSIARAHGTTPEAIWTYNLDPTHGRSPSAIDTLNKRGPNLLFSNELLLIPQ